MTSRLGIETGVPVTLHFVFQDAVANATNVMTLPGGGAGFKVPTGYQFHPVCLHAESDTALTAGTITFKVRADGTALTDSPTAVLTTAIQAAVGVEEIHTEPVDQGGVVSVQAAASSGLTPGTCGLDAVLTGVLVPA
jgi:hypothetical protein